MKDNEKIAKARVENAIAEYNRLVMNKGTRFGVPQLSFDFKTGKIEGEFHEIDTRHLGFFDSMKAGFVESELENLWKAVKKEMKLYTDVYINAKSKVSLKKSNIGVSMSDKTGMAKYTDGNKYFNKDEFIQIVNEDKLKSIVKIRQFRNNCKLIEIIIPEGIEYIDQYTFEETSSLTNVTIPDTVKSIKQFAFKNCSDLSMINIPNSITTLETGVFTNCANLKNINISNSINSIEEMAFSGCLSITSIKIPNSIKVISNKVFYGCISLSSIEIPNSVSKIGKEAFKGCTSLSSIKIPNSVKEIGNFAFSGCGSLVSVNIPDDVKNICKGIFANCTSLTSIIIPNGIVSIGDCAFDGCTSLSSIKIPNSVKEIGNFAFKNCTNLTSIEIPNSVTKIGKGAFAGCTKLTKIIISNSICNIERHAFAGCNSLSSINIPEGLRELSISAFTNTAIKTIKTPKSVKIIHFDDISRQEQNIIIYDTTELDTTISDTKLEHKCLLKVIITDKPNLDIIEKIHKAYIPNTPIEFLYNGYIFTKFTFSHTIDKIQSLNKERSRIARLISSRHGLDSVDVIGDKIMLSDKFSIIN